jgi:hypothetical protein
MGLDRERGRPLMPSGFNLEEKDMQHTDDCQAGRTQGYVICHNRRNAPRISVQVCERACRCKDTCEEYRFYVRSHEKRPPVPPVFGEQGAVFQQ